MIYKAVRNIYPEAVTIFGDTLGAITCETKDGSSITIDESALATEFARLESEYDAQEYARNRASAFPSIGDQLDMQYWDQVNGTTTWQDAVAKVKADNPK